jgi:hypothetical protein
MGIATILSIRGGERHLTVPWSLGNQILSDDMGLNNLKERGSCSAKDVKVPQSALRGVELI